MMATMPGRKVVSASSVSRRIELRDAPSSSSPVSTREALKSTMARSPGCSKPAFEEGLPTEVHVAHQIGLARFAALQSTEHGFGN